MKRETSIYGMFFAGFFFCVCVYQSSKVKNWEQQELLFCFAYTVLYRILDLKAVSQGNLQFLTSLSMLCGL